MLILCDWYVLMGIVMLVIKIMLHHVADEEEEEE